MKARVPKYRAGDLVQFVYNGKGLVRNCTRIVCVEASIIVEGEQEWTGWYAGHVVYDEGKNYEDGGKFKLEDFVYHSSERKLISRIGE